MKYAMKTLPARAVKTALLLVLVSAFSSAALAEKINLNTADAQTMQYIPGIGLNKAEKIIEIRGEAGKFTSMDEIDAVPGIGERTMRDVRKYGSLDSGVSELTEEMKANPPLRSASNTVEEDAVAASS
jgi:competence ComEA-like helix-hairpin-helix protein